MPTAAHSRIVAAPLDALWAFVRDMDNWAPLVTGYERHQKLSDTDSFWFLKGELGGLTRIAEFKVHIDEWDETGHARFSLQGVNEPVTGSGSFDATALAPEGADAPPSPMPAPEPGLLARLRAMIVDRIYGTLFGKRRSPAPAPEAAVGEPRTEIAFALTLTASGGMGMILNALLAPMMRPVAEELADRIAAAVEARR